MHQRSLGVNLWKEIVLIMPVVNPIIIDTPGRQIIEQGAPITTPPAKVALRMLSIYSPRPSETALMMQVPITLPVRARNVFTTIKFCQKEFMAVIPKLKEGQQSHKKRVPIKPKILETQLILMLVQGFILVESMRQVVRPKQAPQVWITELPPASTIPILKQTNCSLRVYPIIWIVPISRMSLGPTLPISPPNAMRTEATEYEHLIRKTMSMLMRVSWKP